MNGSARDVDAEKRKKRRIKKPSTNPPAGTAIASIAATVEVAQAQHQEPGRFVDVRGPRSGLKKKAASVLGQACLKLSLMF